MCSCPHRPNENQEAKGEQAGDNNGSAAFRLYAEAQPGYVQVFHVPSAYVGASLAAAWWRYVLRLTADSQRQLRKGLFLQKSPEL